MTLDTTVLVDDETIDDEEIRPSWRGRIHRYAALLFVPVFVVLVALADTATTRCAMLIYGMGVVTMLGVSAVYHSGRLGPLGKARLKRIDHSTILFGVTGSYTGICTLALNGSAEITMLVFVWTAAVIGIVIRMFWLHAPRWVTATVYMVVGWSALIEISPLMRSLAAGDTALMMVGGGLYSLGAAVYATKRPNWSPKHFGFHEVFHALVVVAAVLHFILVARLLQRV